MQLAVKIANDYKCSPNEVVFHDKSIKSLKRLNVNRPYSIKPREMFISFEESISKYLNTTNEAISVHLCRKIYQNTVKRKKYSLIIYQIDRRVEMPFVIQIFGKFTNKDLYKHIYHYFSIQFLSTDLSGLLPMPKNDYYQSMFINAYLCKETLKQNIKNFAVELSELIRMFCGNVEMVTFWIHTQVFKRKKEFYDAWHVEGLLKKRGFDLYLQHKERRFSILDDMFIPCTKGFLVAVQYLGYKIRLKWRYEKMVSKLKKIGVSAKYNKWKKDKIHFHQEKEFSKFFRITVKVIRCRKFYFGPRGLSKSARGAIFGAPERACACSWLPARVSNDLRLQK